MTPLNWTIASWVIFVLALAWPAWFAARRLARRRRWRVRCEVCRYDLRGTASSRCPACGHDITTPARLIRFRALLLHGMVTFLLLTAAHLVGRVEGIQKRGWIAAVPTSVLIAVVPFERRRPDAPEPFAARELLGHRACDFRSALRGAPFSDAGPSYPMTRWQWWLAIESALSCDFAIHSQRTDWMTNAEDILIAAVGSDKVTPGQLRRILDVAMLTVHTRSEWPLGEEVHARFGSLAQGIGPWVGLDYVARPCEENASLMSFDVAAQQEFATSADWRDCSMLLGKPRSIGPIQYQFIAWRAVSTDTWRELHREVRAITEVVRAEAQILQSVPISDQVIAGTGVRMQIWKHWQFGSPQCAVLLNLVENRRLIEAIGGGTFAVRMRLKYDGETVAERAAWWSKRMGWAPIGGDEWKLGMVVNHDLLNSARESGDHLWSLEIEGDPILALRDFESTSCWAGRYEFKSIPVERVESGK